MWENKFLEDVIITIGAMKLEITIRWEIWTMK